MQVQLIALDWGTSSLRAYKLGAAGRVIEQRTLAYGVMALPTSPRLIQGQACSDGFELAFDEACGDWIDASPQVPVIACGMVGSAQGWHEVAYCPTPARVATLSGHLHSLRSSRGTTLHLVPGVIEHSYLPNVMRGEETQVLGLLQNLPADSRRSPLLIGLPGSHSKWVRVVDGCIEHFDTFMTGEVYAVMCAHSILGRTQQPSQQFASQAFDRGVQVAQSAHGDLGVLSTLFSARTLGLTGQLSACEQADYLSGLIIGHELHALAQAQQRQINAGHQAAFSEVALIGTGALCQRYQRALGLSGFGIASLAPQATELGLWSLACAAQLVIPASEEAPHV